jgi:DNA invertase Pin-like site-specific DNA recombinase
MASDDGFEPKDTMTLDELLLAMRDVVLDASPEDLEAAKLRYDALNAKARAKIEAGGESHETADSEVVRQRIERLKGFGEALGFSTMRSIAKQCSMSRSALYRILETGRVSERGAKELTRALLMKREQLNAILSFKG